MQRLRQKTSLVSDFVFRRAGFAIKRVKASIQRSASLMWPVGGNEAKAVRYERGFFLPLLFISEEVGVVSDRVPRRGAVEALATTERRCCLKRLAAIQV